MADESALRIFPDEFVPQMQASKTYQRWARNSKNDLARWESFRDALLAGQEPSVPSMSTTFGRALVAAGKEHMSITHFVGAPTDPYPPSPPPPPGTPPSFPASFFTGPLGNNNLVPAAADGKVVIMWTGVNGNTEQQQRDLIQQRMADCGRAFDGIQFQGTQLAVGGQSGEDWISSLGSVPCITWNCGAQGSGNTIYTIPQGSANGTIDAIADRFKNKPYRVIIRLMHEFNGGAYLDYWHNNDPAQFIVCWKYIVDRIRIRGATNVGFWWCPNEEGGDPGRATLNACYPGDNYVDWIGTDYYNNGTGGQSSPLHVGWAEFDEIFNYDKYGWTNPSTGGASMCTQWGGRKPFIVGETSSLYDGSNANRKANWFRNIDAVAVPHMPYLRGVAFFDTNTGSLEWSNWRVDANQTWEMRGAQNLGSTDATTYQGFKDLMALSSWRVGFA